MQLAGPEPSLAGTGASIAASTSGDAPTAASTSGDASTGFRPVRSSKEGKQPPTRHASTAHALQADGDTPRILAEHSTRAETPGADLGRGHETSSSHRLEKSIIACLRTRRDRATSR